MKITLWAGTQGLSMAEDGTVSEVTRSQLDAMEDFCPKFHQIETQKRKDEELEKKFNGFLQELGKATIGFILGCIIFAPIVNLIAKYLL